MDDEQISELVKKCDKKTLAFWAKDVAERTLHYFEDEYPHDNRPGQALVSLQEWIRTGEFHMKDVRKASLDAHAAARTAPENSPARFAARACGQAMATAHVKTHAPGAMYYALKAIRAATNSEEEVSKEHEWQYRYLLELLNP